MILLESFTQDDWLLVRRVMYGHAIIRPSEKWVPGVKNFIEERRGCRSPLQLDTAEKKVRSASIDTPEGSSAFAPKERKQCWTAMSQQLWHWLSPVKQVASSSAPLWKITFVNKDDIFQYCNDSAPADEDFQTRTARIPGVMLSPKY